MPVACSAAAEAISESSVLTLLDQLLDKTGYSGFLQDGTEEGKERWQNVLELRTVAAQYDNEAAEPSLGGFLEQVALVSDVDNYEEKVDAVTLLTLHSAKGLEFPVVFIVGLEEGLIPHSRALESQNPADLEEERRLCYVGITRAMRCLHLIHAFRRTIWGSGQTREASRFLKDVPRHLIAGKEPGGRGAGGQRSSGGAGEMGRRGDGETRRRGDGETRRSRVPSSFCVLCVPTCSQPRPRGGSL